MISLRYFGDFFLSCTKLLLICNEICKSCPKKHKKSLTDFIADNKGQKIAIICNNEPKNLHSITSQLEELKSSIKDLSFKEEPHIEGNIIFKKNTKWRVYFITLLENNSQN